MVSLGLFSIYHDQVYQDYRSLTFVCTYYNTVTIYDETGFRLNKLTK